MGHRTGKGLVKPEATGYLEQGKGVERVQGTCNVNSDNDNDNDDNDYQCMFLFSSKSPASTRSGDSNSTTLVCRTALETHRQAVVQSEGSVLQIVTTKQEQIN